MRAIATDPGGGSLPDLDRAVFRFAGKLARSACTVEQADIDALRSLGLSDTDVVDVVLAVAARAFFTTVLDGLGAQLDAETAREFDSQLMSAMVVGRPPASASP